MPESWDDQLRKDEERQRGAGSFDPLETAEPRRKWGLLAAVVLLVVGVGFAVFYYYGNRSDTSEPAAVAEAEPQAEPAATPTEPLGTEVEPIDLPPLAETDPLVRSMVGKLSSHPRVAAWLATDDLVRNFTVVVSNIAEGKTPAVNLRRLRPGGEFIVTERGENLVVDPQSYARYNALADGFASLDAAAAARLYATLKPRIDEAYAELGFPGTEFDAVLERAILLLLRTPVPAEPIHVEQQGATGYAYADPTFEGLTPAQKHLIRMGPRNQRMVQATLRNIALEMGIRANRLPAAGAGQ